LTAGHVGSFAQGAGGLQSFESGDGDDVFHGLAVSGN
jgi:hypothetical protein